LPTVKEVPVGVATEVWFTYTSYPAAGSVPVDAFQESVTLVVVAPLAARPVGVDGEDELLGDCVTTLLAPDVPLVEPLRLDAITVNRSVEPRSDDVTR
jgi:hypothetical protein